MRVAFVTLVLSSALCCSRIPAWEELANRQVAWATELLHAQTGVIVVVNPGTCVFTGELTATMNDLAASTHIPVTVVFFGIAPDSLQHAKIRRDLKLDVPSAIMGQQTLERDIGLPDGGTPTMFIIRQRRLVAVAHGTGVASATRWLGAFIRE